MGEELTVSFDVDARQWQDRWFNSIRAWKVNVLVQQPLQSTGRTCSATGTDCRTGIPHR